MILKNALELFQINVPREMAGVRNFSEATSRLDELKKSIRKEYRRRAKELHPDANGSHEKMVELNTAIQLIDMMHVEPPRPQPMVIVFRQTYSPFGYSNSNSSTDAATATYTW